MLKTTATIKNSANKKKRNGIKDMQVIFFRKTPKYPKKKG